MYLSPSTGRRGLDSRVRAGAEYRTLLRGLAWGSLMIARSMDLMGGKARKRKQEKYRNRFGFVARL